MTPAVHDMPTVTATWVNGHGWVVTLPGDRDVLCVDLDEARALIEREACGSAIRWTGGPASRTPVDPDLARVAPRANRRDEGRPEPEAPGSQSRVVSVSEPAAGSPPVVGVRTGITGPVAPA